MENGHPLVHVDRVSLQQHHLYDLKYRLGDLTGGSSPAAVLTHFGEAPVLFLAPHSTTHYRGGRRKYAEFWTGSLAETLAVLLDGSAITALHPRREAESARSADNFTRMVRLYLGTRPDAFVFDLHGLASGRRIDVNIGSAGSAGRAAETLRGLLGDDFAATVDDPFEGISSIAGMVNDEQLAAGAVQLELGARLRSDTTPLEDIVRLARGLASFARSGDRRDRRTT